MSDLSAYDRGKELTAAERKAIRKLLPDGHELVEGDFNADEKWRINAPEQSVSAEQAPAPLLDYIKPSERGACICGCGETIMSDEATVEDHRGLWKLEHYEPHKDTPTENRKAHARLREMYDTARLRELGLKTR